MTARPVLRMFALVAMFAAGCAAPRPPTDEELRQRLRERRQETPGGQAKAEGRAVERAESAERGVPNDAPIAASVTFNDAKGLNPRKGATFCLRLRSTRREGVSVCLAEAFFSVRFVFTPVDGKAAPLVLPCPFGTHSRTLSNLPYSDSGGGGWWTTLWFPRDLPAGSSMSRDYPTPPPGLYRVRVEMTFPEAEGAWSGSIRTPEVEVRVEAPHD